MAPVRRAVDIEERSRLFWPFTFSPSIQHASNGKVVRPNEPTHRQLTRTTLNGSRNSVNGMEEVQRREEPVPRHEIPTDEP